MPLQTLSFSQFGLPVEVLELTPEPSYSLGPRDLRIRLRMAPINPADFNYVEGTYGVIPSLPAVAGLEGVGEVVEIGQAVTQFQIGQLVRPDRQRGLWREEVVSHEADIQGFPLGLTVEQAAVTSVNPPTAWCLLEEFVALQPGDWVVQNAANSGVGRAVIHLARARGLRTINLVRRPQLIPELLQEGADLVLLDEKAEIARVRQELGTAPVKLGLNAVGGEAALSVAKFLTPNATHVTYGAMAKQPLKIGNGMLIFQNLAFRGFWVTRWLDQAPRERVDKMWAELTDSWQRGILKPGIEWAYKLEDYKLALNHTQREGRKGKIVFQMGG